VINISLPCLRDRQTGRARLQKQRCGGVGFEKKRKTTKYCKNLPEARGESWEELIEKKESKRKRTADYLRRVVARRGALQRPRA